MDNKREVVIEVDGTYYEFSYDQWAAVQAGEADAPSHVLRHIIRADKRFTQGQREMLGSQARELEDAQRYILQLERTLSERPAKRPRKASRA